MHWEGLNLRRRVNFDCPDKVTLTCVSSTEVMKPATGSSVVDEMFPEGGGFMDDDVGCGSGGSGNVIPLLDTNREGIHADFKNDFGDIFDDDDIS